MAISMTQAEFDAKVASGEISLSAPGPKELFAEIGADVATVAPVGVKSALVPSKPSGEMETNATAAAEITAVPKAEGWEELYAPMPLKIKPQPAPVINKAYQKKMSSFLTDARKIEDPELYSQAMELLSSGARWQDIGTALSTLRYNDKAKVKAKSTWEKQKQQALKIKAEVTRDTKKVSPNIINRWGGFAAASDYLGILMETHDDSEVGVLDSATPVQWAKRQLSTGDVDRRSKRDNAYSGLEASLKTAFGFGANYSNKEQEMMQRYIPTQTDGEEGYKKQIVASLEGIKNELLNSVRAQELGKRESQEFKKILSEIDAKIDKAKSFAEESIQERTAEEKRPSSAPAVPEGFKSSRRVTPAVPTSKLKAIQISNIEELDALLGEL
ncbi:MAG: hypothetical protein HF962_00480 [Sulfurovum sp.]|nr:hypothetical protein [Sulfurovum sp.]